jgi:hypothetical protein
MATIGSARWYERLHGHPRFQPLLRHLRVAGTV